MQPQQINDIKDFVARFFETMGVGIAEVTVAPSEMPAKEGAQNSVQEAVDISIVSSDPQFLIGQNGQTLLELQRIFRMVLSKKLQQNMYVNVDVNNYRRKKVMYLKNLAKNVADEVFLNRTKKILPPMSAYERRIIHAELAARPDVVTESQGEGEDRCVVVSPVA